MSCSVLAGQQCVQLFTGEKKHSKQATELRSLFPSESELWGVELVKDSLTKKLLSDVSADTSMLLLRFLKSMGETVFENASLKSTFEKGSLVLAEPLKNGDSLELEYLTDQRGQEDVFRLKKVTYVKQSGARHVLSKKPLDDSGKEFKTSDFLMVQQKEPKSASIHTTPVSYEDLKTQVTLMIQEKEIPELSWFENSNHKHHLVDAPRLTIYEKLLKLAPFLTKENQQSIKGMENHMAQVAVFPVIYGEVLHKLKKWVPILPYLKKTELRDLTTSKWHLSRVFLKGKIREAKDLLKEKIIKKQTLKFALFGAIFFGVTSLTQKEPVVISEPVSSVVHQQMDTLFNKVSPVWKLQYPKWENSYREQLDALDMYKDKNKNSESRTAQLESYLHWLLSLEKNVENEGTLRIWSKNRNQSKWNEVIYLNQLVDVDYKNTVFGKIDLKQDTYVVLFQETQKILLINALSIEDLLEKYAAYFLISKETSPKFYDSFLKVLL
jgi:hypothetical protein